MQQPTCSAARILTQRCSLSGTSHLKLASSGLGSREAWAEGRSEHEWLAQRARAAVRSRAAPASRLCIGVDPCLVACNERLEEVGHFARARRHCDVDSRPPAPLVLAVPSPLLLCDPQQAASAEVKATQRLPKRVRDPRKERGSWDSMFPCVNAAAGAARAVGVGKSGVGGGGGALSSSALPRSGPSVPTTIAPCAQVKRSLRTVATRAVGSWRKMRSRK